MKNVNRVVGRDGKARLYFRQTGLTSIPLRSPEGSPELEAEVAAIRARLKASTPLPGTLAGALRAYELTDADFLGLADSTKTLYRGYMKELDADLGDLAVETFQPSFVLTLKNAWAPRGHRATNVLLQVLKNALKPAMIGGQIPANTFELVGQARRPAHLDEPNIIWPMHVVSLVIERCLDGKRYGLARAVAIARFVGPRRGDLVKLTKGARAGGRFRFLSGKRRVPVNQKEDPRLTRLLETIPDQQPLSGRAGRKVGAGVTPLPTLHLVFNLAGRPYTESGLAEELAKIVGDLFEAKAIETDAYGQHGLRHSRGVEAALAGCTDAQGAALLGHASPSSFAQYRRQADRINLADDAADKIVALSGRDEDRARNISETEAAKQPAK